MNHLPTQIHMQIGLADQEMQKNRYGSGKKVHAKRQKPSKNIPHVEALLC